MHHRTCSVIKLQIKLISDKSPGNIYQGQDMGGKKNSLICKNKGRAGG